jgi:16S rRNA (cytidine1402-2'-O)-methyltransferase
MLWIVGTPIGNLGDLSERTKTVLEQCDLILCEDTRHSAKLLFHLNIKKPLKSFHKFNESKSQSAILEMLKAGKTIALISDAGMPAISDPGQSLIAACHQENIPVSTVPGPNAALLGLVLSGFSTIPFQFLGFLSKKQTEQTEQLLEIFHYRGTSIVYETPHRIIHTLQLIEKVAPNLTLCLARELTKKFEECLLGTAQDLLKKESLKDPKGEMVLVFSEHPIATTYCDLSPQEHVLWIETTFAVSQKEAIAIAARIRKESKKQLYTMFNKKI